MFLKGFAKDNYDFDDFTDLGTSGKTVDQKKFFSKIAPPGDSRGPSDPQIVLCNGSSRVLNDFVHRLVHKIFPGRR